MVICPSEGKNIPANAICVKLHCVEPRDGPHAPWDEDALKCLSSCFMQSADKKFCAVVKVYTYFFLVASFLQYENVFRCIYITSSILSTLSNFLFVITGRRKSSCGRNLQSGWTWNSHPGLCRCYIRRTYSSRGRDERIIIFSYIHVIRIITKFQKTIEFDNDFSLNTVIFCQWSLLIRNMFHFLIFLRLSFQL